MISVTKFAAGDRQGVWTLQESGGDTVSIFQSLADPGGSGRRRLELGCDSSAERENRLHSTSNFITFLVSLEWRAQDMSSNLPEIFS